ncbi:MAG: sensor histidine kinase, partial [Limisphaerales bacterium]
IDVSHLALMWVNHRRHTEAAGVLLLSELLVLVTALAATAGGMHAPAVYGYLVLVVVAGLLFGARGAIVSGLAGSVAGLGLVVLDRLGRLPISAVHHTAISLWIGLMLFIGLVIGLQYLATRAISDALRRTRMELAERKKAEQLVARERNFSEAVINSTPGILALFDQDGFRLWNPSAELITGYSAEETKRMNPLEFVDETERPKLEEAIRKVFAGEHVEVEVTLVCKSGKRIPYYFNGALVVVEGVPCVLTIGVDLSERQLAEREVKILNETLERRVVERTTQLDAINKELEGFSYSVSHDLRAPLRAINNFAQVLRSDHCHVLDADGRQCVERIYDASCRMGRLIDDLLKYSRIGRERIALHAVPLKVLLAQIGRDFQPRLDSVGGVLSVPDELPVVIGDETLLTQVFTNLLDNAVTYRRKDTPLRIEVDWRKEPTDVVIGVTDNGIGIAPADQKRIFDVFSRLHTNSEYEGTGIGLATVKTSIETLGGAVWVESEPGKGSTFFVRLKMAQVK